MKENAQSKITRWESQSVETSEGGMEEKRDRSSGNTKRYSRFRTIAVRRKMKLERDMQSKVAITVTNVPLSGAE